MQSAATTVAAYLAALPPERRATLSAIRKVILQNLNKGYEEGMQYGMIGYYVPHSLYPAGYHCDPQQPLPFVGLASQKNYYSLYAFCLYDDPAQMEWFRKAWAESGKKLDMGKSCIRFKTLADAPLEVIGELIRRVPVRKHIQQYEAAVGVRRKRKTQKPDAEASFAPKPSSKGRTGDE